MRPLKILMEKESVVIEISGKAKQRRTWRKRARAKIQNKEREEENKEEMSIT